eukprot:EG_transcript_20531
MCSPVVQGRLAHPAYSRSGVRATDPPSPPVVLPPCGPPPVVLPHTEPHCADPSSWVVWVHVPPTPALLPHRNVSGRTPHRNAVLYVPMGTIMASSIWSFHWRGTARTRLPSDEIDPAPSVFCGVV